ncbi:MAG: hypothetical protein SVV80_01935 [Planctomycetota bacterium]|nr:hypothetical protein [Planctomycetota bacterium]
MIYDSVDRMQQLLAEDVFHYAKDAKKAAGRALGTLVEIVSFYLLKSWGLERHIAVERRLPEYANPDIMHNVEFSLHPSVELAEIRISREDLPITPKKILKQSPDYDPPATTEGHPITYLVANHEECLRVV